MAVKMMTIMIIVKTNLEILIFPEVAAADGRVAAAVADEGAREAGPPDHVADGIDQATVATGQRSEQRSRETTAEERTRPSPASQKVFPFLGGHVERRSTFETS